jgi:hypothetical protein
MKTKTENNPSMETAVLIPLLQAIVTGTVLSVLTGFIVTMVGNERYIEWSIIVFLVSISFGWFAYRAQWSGLPNDSLPNQEYQVETQSVSLALTWDQGKQGEWIDGLDWIKFSTWAVAVFRGTSMGENHWTGSGNLFSKGEYHRMIDILQSKGIVRMKGKHYSSGYELTGKGRALCRGIESQYGAPTHNDMTNTIH